MADTRSNANPPKDPAANSAEATAQEEKRRAEQKLWEQHAALLYLQGLKQDKINARWTRLDEKEIQASDEPQPQDPESTSDFEADSFKAPLFMKPGLYENEAGAIVRVVEDKDGNKRIYAGKNGNIMDTYNFALAAQGALATGIEYDVGAFADPNTQGIAAFKRSHSVREYESRLKNIEAIQDRAFKNGVEVTLSDNTKSYLKALLTAELISPAQVQTILDKEEMIILKATEKKNQFLTGTTIGEDGNRIITHTSSVSDEIKKIQGTIKVDDFKISDKTSAEDIAKNVKNELAKVETELALLTKTANQVEQQVSTVNNTLDKRQKLENAGLETATQNPTNAEDKEAAIKLGKEIEANSTWVTDSKLQDLLSNKDEKDIAAIVKIKLLKERVEELKKTLQETIDGTKLGEREKKQKDTTKKRNDTEQDAKNLVADVIEHNKDATKAKIDIFNTAIADINHALQPKTFTPETLELAKMQEIEKLLKKIEDHNDTVTEDKDKIILSGAGKTSVADINIKLKLTGDNKITENALNFLTNGDMVNKLHKKLGEDDYPFEHRNAAFKAEKALKEFKDKPDDNKAEIDKYNALKKELDTVNTTLGEKAKADKPATGLEEKLDKAKEKFNKIEKDRIALAARLDELKQKNLEHDRKSAPAPIK